MPKHVTTVQPQADEPALEDEQPDAEANKDGRDGGALSRAVMGWMIGATILLALPRQIVAALITAVLAIAAWFVARRADSAE